MSLSARSKSVPWMRLSHREPAARLLTLCAFVLHVCHTSRADPRLLPFKALIDDRTWSTPHRELGTLRTIFDHYYHRCGRFDRLHIECGALRTKFARVEDRTEPFGALGAVLIAHHRATDASDAMKMVARSCDATKLFFRNSIASEASVARWAIRTAPKSKSTSERPTQHTGPCARLLRRVHRTVRCGAVVRPHQVRSSINAFTRHAPLPEFQVSKAHMKYTQDSII